MTDATSCLMRRRRYKPLISRRRWPSVMLGSVRRTDPPGTHWSAFHAGNTASNPVGDGKYFAELRPTITSVNQRWCQIGAISGGLSRLLRPDDDLIDHRPQVRVGEVAVAH